MAQAYEVLSDPEARARYDRFGEAGVGGAGGGAGPNFGDMFGGAGLGDLLGTIFGGGGNPFGGGGPAGPPRGQDLEVVADITFEQSIFGATVPVTVRTAVRCEDCDGTGAGQGTQPVTCSECNGRGQVAAGAPEHARPDGHRRRCARGAAASVRSSSRRARRVAATAGWSSTRPTRSTSRPASTPVPRCDSAVVGRSGPRRGAAGDLYVHIRVAPSELFSRDGDDLVHVFTVSIAQAALGTRSTLATPDGEIELVVQPGTQPGRELVFRGKGVHRSARSRSRRPARAGQRRGAHPS